MIYKRNYYQTTEDVYGRLNQFYGMFCSEYYTSTELSNG